MNLYTASINYKGEDRLDISVKTGNLIYAPTWDLVMGIKKGFIDKDKYIRSYMKMMRISYNHHRLEWNELLSKDEVTLVCYCHRNTFCHRYILAYMLTRLGAVYMGERTGNNPEWVEEFFNVLEQK